MEKKVWAKVEYFPDVFPPRVTFYRRSRVPKNQVFSDGHEVKWVKFECIDFYGSCWLLDDQLPYGSGEYDRNGKPKPTTVYLDACIAVDEKRAVYNKSYYSE